VATREDVGSDPIVTSLRAEHGQPTIPFVGVVEGMGAAAFRRAGVSMHHISGRALRALAAEMDVNTR
jgi:hypothetical protein